MNTKWKNDEYEFILQQIFYKKEQRKRTLLMDTKCHNDQDGRASEQLEYILLVNHVLYNVYQYLYPYRKHGLQFLRLRKRLLYGYDRFPYTLVPLLDDRNQLPAKFM